MTTDYEMHGIDPTCPCGGDGDSFHRENARCSICHQCGQRIKGIWWIAHIVGCWPMKVKK
jgi:hypothetical protein